MPKTYWFILVVTAVTDGIIAFGTSVGTAMVDGKAGLPSWPAIAVAGIGGVVVIARTIQQALKPRLDKFNREEGA